MLLNFNEIDETVINKFKGGEGDTIARMLFDGFNKIMYGKLPVGATIGYHPHEANSEIIYILSGEAKCLYDEKEEYLTSGECHYCPMGHSHSLVNNSPTDELVFFAVVPEHKK